MCGCFAHDMVYPCDAQFSRYQNHLAEWCHSRIRSKEGFDLLRQLFAYDPDNRLTAREALQHKWFKEEPRPTAK